MSTRRQRSRRRETAQLLAAASPALRQASRDIAAATGGIDVLTAQRRILQAIHPRRTREVELADLTATEAARRHLEEARPLLELAVAAASDEVWPDGLSDRALIAAVRIAGPCPAGWCRYPAGHTGDHEPLDAA